MFVSRDDATLLNLFLEQRVAYQVAGPEVLPRVWEKLGKENVGVVPLPAGPRGPAGPFLRVDALMFNSSSSERQLRIALALSRFLTNTEQSATLVRELGLVPANRRVHVDRRAYPSVGGFVAQSRTSVSVPNTPQMDLINKLGDSIFTQVLEGVLDATDASRDITQQVNEAFGSSDAGPTPVSHLATARESYA
jgi:arabinogalactan oligomer/maltooligosaccharide transport system substrate-binding protein